MKRTFLIVCFFSHALLLFSGEHTRQITNALNLAYNFQFEEAERALSQFRIRYPDSVEGDIGTIVYDFLLINQDPSEENFDRIYSHLEIAEDKVESYLRDREDEVYQFYKCFINYYYMKSFALDDKWIRTVVYAARARELAIELQDMAGELPDLYFILGDQDYSTSLVPEYLLPLLRTLDFTPDRYKGLSLIGKAVEVGEFTRNEASLFYISSCIYVEKDFQQAYERSVLFLEKYPDNLSVRFYLIDLLLRLGKISDAENQLDLIGRGIESGDAGAKWTPRYIQMRGNLCNARGQWEQAVELYREALEYSEISQYSVTEITLETGKLYDIMGERRLAVRTYKECVKSRGLELQRDEARLLRREPYTGERGSY